MKVVPCEVCDRKMSKLPKHMQERWGGNICGDCREKLKSMETKEFLEKKKIEPEEFEEMSTERKKGLYKEFKRWQKGELIL